MFRILCIAVVSSLFGAFLFLPALAGDTATVTVIPCTVAANVTDGSVAFGTLNLSPSAASPVKKNTVVGDPRGGAAETQTITNTGTCAADLMLRASDATSTGAAWDLVACNAVAADAFGLQFEVGNTGSVFDGTDFPPDNTNTLDVGDVNANGGTISLDIGICMPTNSSDGALKSITVTVVLTGKP